MKTASFTREDISHPYRMLILYCLLILSSIAIPAKLFSQDFSPDTLYQIFTNSPVQEGDDLIIYVTNGQNFSWTGPNGYTDSIQYIRIGNVDSTYDGNWQLSVYDSILQITRFLQTSISITPDNNADNIYLQIETPSVCLSSIISFGVSPITGYNISWTTNLLLANPPLLPVWQQNITLSAMAAPGIYFVICSITEQNTNALLATETGYITVFNCCESNKAIFIENKTITNANPSSWPTAWPITIVIKGTLTIDASFTFPSNVAEIVLLPRSSIFVEPAINLGIAGTPTDLIEIKGCEELWDWILLSDNSTLRMAYCEVSDANIAIWAPWWLTPGSAPAIILNNNIFIQNLYALYTCRATVPLTLEGNTFSGSGQALLPSTNPIFATASYHKAYTGIYIWDSPSFEMNPTYINYFSKLAMGIHAVRSNLIIQQDAAIFNNINDFVGIGTSPWAAAISIFSSYHYASLLKQGNSSSYQPDFDDCQIGILAHTANAEIQGNSMTNMQIGIKSEYCQGKTLIAKDNIIHCTVYGFFLFWNGAVSNFDIYDNQIYLTAVQDSKFANACIEVVDFNPPRNPDYRIHNNQLQVNIGCYGIDLLGASGIEIFENSIKLADPSVNTPTIAGINLHNSHYNTINCNYIKGMGPERGIPANNTPFGILSDESESNEYFFNFADSTLSGVGFEGNCVNTRFHDNHFFRHDIGLWYNINALTGPQPLAANQWHTNCLSFKAYSVNPNSPSSNMYLLGTQCSPCDPNPFAFPNSWFPYSSNPTPISQSPCSGPPASLSDITVVDSSIAFNTMQFLSFEEELKWNTARSLFEKLSLNPELAASNALMLAFADSIHSTSAGHFEVIERNTKDTLSLPTGSMALLDSLDTVILRHRDSLISLSTLLKNALTPEDSISLLSLHLEEIASLLLHTNQYYDVLAGFEAVRNNRINNLLIDNQELPDFFVYESNEKTVNNVYLNTLAKGIFSYSGIQLTALRNIACQCPVAGGDAVYMARAMLSHIHDSLYDDRAICLQAGMIKFAPAVKPKTDADQILFSVFPNPASTSFTLNWDVSKEAAAEISVVDPSGKVVYLQNIRLKNQRAVIPTVSLSPGEYFLFCRYDKGNSFIGRITVIR